MAIVRAVTGLGKSLGIVTTAEGVETGAQFELLRQEGCTQAQGYLFSKPRPVAEVDAMLERPPKRIVALDYTSLRSFAGNALAWCQ